MDGLALGAAALVLLIFFLMIGVPLFVGCILALLFMIFVGGHDPLLIYSYSYNRITSMVLLAFPLFTLAGGIMEQAGIAERLVDFINIVTRRFKGGLGAVGVITNAIFGACSTSASAAITCIGPMMIPRLVKEGYPRPYSTALMTASAGLAMVIPPSGHMILYGWISYTPVTALFLGALLPGLACAILFILWNRMVYTRFPASQQVRKVESIRSTVGALRRSTLGALPALLFPVVILGSIYAGIASPTESAGIAVLYSAFVGFFVYRRMNLRQCWDVMLDRATLIGVVIILIFFSMSLGRLFAMERVPEELNAVMLSLTDNKYILLLMLNVLFVVLGMIMDDASAIIIGTALTFPIATGVGMHPVQFGTVVCINTALGTMTPPVAGLLFLGQRVGNVEFADIIKPVTLLLLVGYVPIILLATYWPAFSLWLPTLVLGPKAMGVL